MEDDLKKIKMEDDFNFFWNTRMTTLKEMEDNLKKMEDDLKKNEKWKTTSKKMEGDLNKKLKLEDDLKKMK